MGDAPNLMRSTKRRNQKPSKRREFSRNLEKKVLLKRVLRKERIKGAICDEILTTVSLLAENAEIGYLSSLLVRPQRLQKSSSKAMERRIIEEGDRRRGGKVKW